MLRETWSESLGDPELVSTLEEVLLLVADPQAEAAALSGEQHLRAVGREIAWTGQWIVQVAGSWRAAEEIEAWEDRLLSEAEAVAHEMADLASLLLAGEPSTGQLGDGLRSWRLCHLGNGRRAIVRLLQALEQSVERVGGHAEAGLALMGELYAAERALRATAEELRALSALPQAPETLAQLVASMERLRAARAEGAAGARAWRAQQASRPPAAEASSVSAVPPLDPSVPLALLAADLLLQQLVADSRKHAVSAVADAVARRGEWGGNSLHPRAIASLVVGDLLDPARRRETLERLGREVASGRAAVRVLEALHPPQSEPATVPKALDELVEAGRIEPWEAEAFLLVHRGTLGAPGTRRTHPEQEYNDEQ